MPKRKQDLTRHHILLRRGDVEELQIAYPDVGASVIIRQLIAAHVDKIKAAAPKSNLQVEIAL